ncbi:spermidine synthase [Actinomadura syzygii]|uniref:Spermidine synthase n=1 Tax=Actinomadura syzygii TaxID=1427538 RepID=A0A5D0UHF5_9ACTN|nr:spermidine synthase [Actinomadura syzygii]TYC16559.1 spermidine synthase [Actinomadura syzygii]
MGVVAGTSGGPVVVERADGVGGELVLRRAGDDYEIISNGVFLMDTRDGTSERLLVRAAVDGLDGPVRLLIGGLGVGFSLAEALDLPEVAHVTVVEREPAVVDWHRGVLRPWSRGAVDDPRVTVRCADLLDVLAGPVAAEPVPAGGGGRFDALCLDIDNGPGWTVTPGNARLYSPAGLDLLAARLTRRGTLAVWSAAADPAFEALLRDRFAAVEARPVPVPRGEPDVVYLARRPRRTA